MRFAILFLAGCSFHGPSLSPDGGSIDARAVDGAQTCFGASCTRTRIAIHHELIAGPLANFPVLLHLTGIPAATATGFDLVFAQGTTRLPYEREHYASGDLLAWVAVPALSDTTDTIIDLYTGDAAATDQQDPTHVWDAHFQGVWHLDNTVRATGDIVDATANRNNGTDSGSPRLDAAGQIGNATQFDGLDDALDIPASVGLGGAAATGTLSLWVNWTNSMLPTSQRLLMSSNTFAGDNSGFEWAINSAHTYYFYPADAGGLNDNAIADPFTDNAWHLAAVTLDFASTTVAMYVDGKPLALTQHGVPTHWTRTATSGDWLWGGGPARNLFVGMMDEIHISDVVRSDAWLATEYANQHDPASFATLIH